MKSNDLDRKKFDELYGLLIENNGKLEVINAQLRAFNAIRSLMNAKGNVEEYVSNCIQIGLSSKKQVTNQLDEIRLALANKTGITYKTFQNEHTKTED
jgi:hypothetical protein